MKKKEGISMPKDLLPKETHHQCRPNKRGAEISAQKTFLGGSVG